MDDAAVEDLLRTAGWGVLSLADGGVPYSLPVSFGYDGDAVYFGLLREADGDGEKFAFVADGGRARLLVTDVRARFDWRSVAVTGPLRAVEAGSDAFARLRAVLAANPWFSSGVDDAPGVEAVEGWRLDPEARSGREVRPEGG
jgi:hypothetical protein